MQFRLVGHALTSFVLLACADDSSSPEAGQTSGSSSTHSGTTANDSDASGSGATTGSADSTETGEADDSGGTSSGGETGGVFPADTRIAFIRLVGGGYQTFVAEADGSGEVQLTDGTRSTLDVAWAPDGQRLTVSDGSVLRVIEDDGANPFDVMLPEPYVSVRRASWAPDNETVVFDAGNGIYTTVAEPGSAPAPLLIVNVNDGPEWSPDGSSIVYTRGIGTPGIDQDGVYLIDADGGNERLLTAVEWGQLTSAAWLRDGETVVFNDRDENGILQIYAVQSDGSGRRALTDEPFDVAAPRRCAEPDCAFVIEFGEDIESGAYRLNTVTGDLTLAVPDAILVVTVP
ncbi:MAG: TolB family protein [Nannocystales bacterium]